MDQWEFKKWRKTLGLNQVAAGEMLGLSRGAIQYWENDKRPVPRAVELACQELFRRWKQRPDFGPVTLLYSIDQFPTHDTSCPSNLTLRFEPHPDNRSALGRGGALSASRLIYMPLILDDAGTAVWAGPELLRVCEKLGT